ncbi:SagB family peptide dehydrogenase [Micromonospora sp. NBC_01699]|uniref:SagB family peptide dehydrogenase n=1 Tax=Micromonospora sp. NBC_01699 TaxID=2975984 RepID=UPI002E3541E0|nr:SagB family peptide dehydrogenase [Micromonospora sp. NBC_01699]
MWRGRVPMEPVDFTPDWGDAPRKGRFFPGVDLLPLPTGDVPATASVQNGLHPPTDRPGRGFTLPTLGGMLLDSCATIGRRLGVQANTDLAALPSYPHANWFRGTASGGGLYPCAVYWVCGPSGPLTPGVYHYSTPRHALAPLLTGDVTGVVRAALGDLPAATGTDQFLLLGVKMWQNAFKYNSFSYHAVTMDVGTVVQTWRIWAQAQGLRVDPVLWFDEEPLNRLLGVSAEDEGIFAVVPLPWSTTAAPPTGDDTRASAPDRPAPAVRHRDRERSRRVLTFDAPRRMRRATIGYAARRPAPDALRTAAAVAAVPGPRLALPEPRPLTVDVRTALRRRRSSFGRFEARTPIEAEQLAALLAASAGARFDTDAAGPHLPPLTKVYAFVNHVRNVPPGAYEYEPVSNALRLVRPGPPGGFLQRNYFLANYNLEQAAAVLVPTVRTAAVLGAVGDRGYHLVNATIGAVAQNCYTAASAAGLGCGVALGFDNISYVEELELADSGEYPLLIMLVGHERPDPADFRYELV